MVKCHLFLKESNVSPEFCIHSWAGPQCVLSCAKEQRCLPKQGFTCCLAMDGVKVLASGFDIDEKVLYFLFMFHVAIYFLLFIFPS